MEWIAFTIFAAAMQAVRTAGQKHLTTSMSAIASTWARYGFGIPLAVIYFFLINWQTGTSIPPVTTPFLFFIVLAAVTQLTATLLLVKVLSMRNFAAGSTYAKTEVIWAALLGVLIFNAQFNALTFLAIVLGIAGIIFVSMNKLHLNIRVYFQGPTPWLGVSAGVCFALTSLCVHEANNYLNATPIYTASLILLLSLSIQGVLCTVLVHWQNPQNWRQLIRHAKTSLFVGATGTLGSIGWYTAFSYQEVAIVKSLGQIEFLFTIVLTYLFFKERIYRVEWFGMLLVCSSVVLLITANL